MFKFHSSIYSEVNNSPLPQNANCELIGFKSVIRCCHLYKYVQIKINDIVYNFRCDYNLYSDILIFIINNHQPYGLFFVDINCNYRNSVTIDFYIDINLMKNNLDNYIVNSILYKSGFSDYIRGSKKLPIPFKSVKNISNYTYLPKKYNKYIKQKFPMLYDYQCKNIHKMLSLEKDNKFSYKVKKPDNYQTLGDFNYTFKLNGNIHEIEPVNDITDSGYDEIKFNVSGGILADEMGLGKTISMIGLMYLNKLDKINSEFIDGNINTKCTLIIVPNHLAPQWLGEIQKYIPNLVINKIFTKRDHQNLTYNDIINSDVLIVTQQFLLNFNYYIRYKYDDKITPSRFNMPDRINAINKLLTKIKKNKTWQTETGPILEHFHFHRLVIDEGHEIFNQSLGNKSLNYYLLEYLKNLNSTYNWYVSGTPFTNYEGIYQCMKFIKVDNNTYYKEYRYQSYQLLEQVMIRSLKSDVENEIKIPGSETKLIKVKLTKKEKEFYEMKKQTTTKIDLQKLCCHPLIIDSMVKIIKKFDGEIGNIEDIADKFVKYHQNRVEDYTFKLEKLNPASQAYHMTKKKYTEIINESKYLLNTFNKVTSNKDELSEEECPICMCEFEDTVMTKCGHLFCKECILESLNVNNLCPTCRKPVESGGLLSINNDQEKKEEIVEEVKDTLIEKYGTKLATLIKTVRQILLNKENKIIIFSQWDMLLALIGKSLKENGVANTFIKGNVYCRNKAISKFKMNDNDSSVIMLSLENAASGTNLTEATHIIFIEPVDKEVEDIKAIEGQAIGRVCRIGKNEKVQIIRIITENTIEEDIYNEKYI